MKNSFLFLYFEIMGMLLCFGGCQQVNEGELAAALPANRHASSQYVVNLKLGESTWISSVDINVIEGKCWVKKTVLQHPESSGYVKIIRLQDGFEADLSNSDWVWRDTTWYDIEDYIPIIHIIDQPEQPEEMSVGKEEKVNEPFRVDKYTELEKQNE